MTPVLELGLSVPIPAVRLLMNLYRLGDISQTHISPGIDIEPISSLELFLNSYRYWIHFCTHTGCMTDLTVRQELLPIQKCIPNPHRPTNTDTECMLALELNPKTHTDPGTDLIHPYCTVNRTIDMQHNSKRVTVEAELELELGPCKLQSWIMDFSLKKHIRIKKQCDKLCTTAEYINWNNDP